MGSILFWFIILISVLSWLFNLYFCFVIFILFKLVKIFFINDFYFLINELIGEIDGYFD